MEHTNSAFCFQESNLSLKKSIKIISKEFRKIEDFLKIINKFISFVSFSLKRKVLALDIQSYSEFNTAKRNLKIYTSQYKIFDTDFKKEIEINQILVSYGFVQNKIGTIVRNYFKLSEKEYREFGVVIDLYIRNQDAPYEPYSQVSFLVYTQAIEALINSKKYNNRKSIDTKSKNILENFKEKYHDLPEIQNLKINTSFNFTEKIYNFIVKENIEKILDFKYYEKHKIYLIRDIVKIRNYFTHYSSYKKELNKINLYDLRVATKLLLEIFILKELGIPTKIIKWILKLNYPNIKNWDFPYMTMLSPLKKNYYSISNYLGDFYFFDNKQFHHVDLYYKENKKNIDLICCYIFPQKEREIVQIYKNTDINKLKQIFKICYDRFLEKKRQKDFKHKS